MIYEVTIAGKIHHVELVRTSAGWLCKIDKTSFSLDVVGGQSDVLSLLIEGKSYEIKQEVNGADTNIVVGHERFSASVRDPRSLRARRRTDSDTGPRKI